VLTRGGGTNVKRPSSEGSMSRIRSPRGRVRTARVKGPEWLWWLMAEAESLRDLIVLVRRSMWSVKEGILVRRIGGTCVVCHFHPTWLVHIARDV
jgi:hypothetical protein